jgi:drug/metabolite transporter (DMT)-like permease
MLLNVVLFASGILLGSAGGVLLKYGAGSLPKFEPTLAYAVAFISNIYILGGFFLYLIPALIWTYLLSKLPVSVVQPVLALTYVVTPILATLFLKESVPMLRWFGILIIVCGVGIVAVS